jgi:hypothetical protein
VRMTLVGANFRPGATVVISPPLAAVTGIPAPLMWQSSASRFVPSRRCTPPSCVLTFDKRGCFLQNGL